MIQREMALPHHENAIHSEVDMQFHGIALKYVPYGMYMCDFKIFERKKTIVFKSEITL